MEAIFEKAAKFWKNTYSEADADSQWVDPSDSSMDEKWEEAISSEQQRLDQATLNVAVLGTVNSGKSSFIRALTGREDIITSPVAGETKFTKRYIWPNLPNMYISDTPGLEDIDVLASAKATDYVEQDADIILFFVNAAVGVTRPVIQTYTNFKTLGKPIVVLLSKIDAEDVAGRRIAINDCNKKLDLTDPLHQVIPVSMRAEFKEQSVIDVIARVTHLLHDNMKTILWARMCKHKEEQAKNIILWAAGEAFAIGAIPIPGSDAILLNSLQFGLAFRLASLYEREINRELIKEIFMQIGISALGKQMYRELFKLGGVIFAGPTGGASVALASAIAAVTAGAMTYGLGYVLKLYFQSDISPAVEDLIEEYKRMTKEYKQFKELTSGNN